MRSHRLAAGQRTLLDVTFRTSVDGVGQHGEALDVITDRRPAPREPGQHDVWFLITVRAA